MIVAICLLAAVTFAESKTLALQVCLDREGYSCNTIDGQWGRKSQSALEKYCAERSLAVPETPEEAYDALFSGKTPPLFREDTVTQDDIDALVDMPEDPAAKAQLEVMGYQTIKEMFAERGHLSRRALERLNPKVDFENITPGVKIRLPDFPSMDEELAVWPKDRPNAPKRPEAAQVRVSLSRFEVAAYDRSGRMIALFPCSIAKNKAKLPPHGELKIVNQIARPNYTYTPDYTPPGKKVSRYIWPSGPRCPVGMAWLGLDMPGYGMHGTPKPESIGNAESHGCFRLANWNAARLYALCPIGTPVIVEP
ncbi:MAG: L,D-transpeptidase family protein [Kiritimatiellae bacterium]|nr:L,D-transpeptidase family protein [Kiritimatiellia bacterium]